MKVGEGRIDMTLGGFKPCKYINSQMMIIINVINVSGMREVGFVCMWIRRIDIILGAFKPCKCINSQMMIIINVIHVSGMR